MVYENVNTFPDNEMTISFHLCILGHPRHKFWHLEMIDILSDCNKDATISYWKKIAVVLYTQTLK
jgi:hypothetical protein